MPKRAARPLGELLVLRADQRRAPARPERHPRQDGLLAHKPGERWSRREGSALAGCLLSLCGSPWQTPRGLAAPPFLPRRRRHARGRHLGDLQANGLQDLSPQEFAALVEERINFSAPSRSHRYTLYASSTTTLVRCLLVSRLGGSVSGCLKGANFSAPSRSHRYTLYASSTTTLVRCLARSLRVGPLPVARP